MLPRQCQVKGVHHHQALTIWNVKGTYLRKKKKIKNMSSEMTTNSQLSTTDVKKQKQKWTKQTTRTGTDSQE